MRRGATQNVKSVRRGATEHPRTALSCPDLSALNCQGSRQGSSQAQAKPAQPQPSRAPIHETAFSSTGRGESPSQAHTRSMRRPFLRQTGGFSSTGRGKSSSQARTKSMRRPFRRQAGGKAGMSVGPLWPHKGLWDWGIPEIAFSSTGSVKRPSQALPGSPAIDFSSTGRVESKSGGLLESPGGLPRPRAKI